jgi:hypothetical protein
MNRLKSVAGYLWAVFALFVVLATFLANDSLSSRFASSTGLVVSPRYTGGEVVRIIDHGTYKTLVHRPVFDGLIAEKKEGFVQINWEAVAETPPIIQEKIDFNGDEKDDFLITLDTRTGTFDVTPYSPAVGSIERTYKLKKGWAVRVHLKRG